MQELASEGGCSLRVQFAKLNQIVLILGFERPGDILDFTIPAELMDMHAIAEVMRCRPDFDPAQIDKAVGTFAAQMLSQ
jgi:hypothetical protein